MKKLIGVLALSVMSTLSMADCVDDKIDVYHNAMGDDAPIHWSTLKEWKEECAPKARLSLGNERYRRHMGWDYVTLVNQGERIKITGYKVNNGYCANQQPMAAGSFTMSPLGDMNIVFNKNCNLQKVEVFTNQGNFVWTF